MNFDRNMFGKLETCFDDCSYSISSRSDTLSHGSITIPGRAGRANSSQVRRPHRNSKRSNRGFQNKGQFQEPTSAPQQRGRSNMNLPSTSTHNENSSSKYYICPGCKLAYNYIKNNSILIGRVPRILPCHHTVCEDCIKLSLKTMNTIHCALCSKAHGKNYKTLDYNYHIIGHITCLKMNCAPLDFSNITLVSTKMMDDNVSSETLVFVPQEEKCGLGGCQNCGTISCTDCSGLYCKKCDEALHNSGKQLKKHRRNVNQKLSLDLNECPDHSLLRELFCNECEESCCCYCMLEKHEGHSRSYLVRLNKEEEIELEKMYRQASNKLEQLYETQKKMRSPEIDKVSNLELEIAKCFTDVHARLSLIEKKLLIEAKLLKNNGPNTSEFCRKIHSNIETLKYLKHCVDQREHMKLNLKLLLAKLTEIQDMPTSFDCSENSGYAVKLNVDSKICELEYYFQLNADVSKPLEVPDFQGTPKNPEYEQMKEVLRENTISIPTNLSEVATKLQENNQVEKTNSNNNYFQEEIVYVTHIQSLDCFYVQFKKEQSQFKELEREINMHVGNISLGVNEVEIGELYMAISIVDRNKWVRIRAVKKVETEDNIKFQVHFIDYGTSAVCYKKDLKYISSSLANKKPFAVQCKLDNLGQVDKWPKNSHLKLANLLSGKQEVTMITKEFSNNVYTVDLYLNTSQQRGYESVVNLLSLKRDTVVLSPSELESPPSGITSTSQIFDNSDNFKEGESHDIFVRYVLDPSNIYIQKATYENCLTTLTNALDQYYQKSQCDIHLPVKNSDVVAYYTITDYGSWHRARILNVFHNKKNVQVLLVDWGKTINVPWKLIRRLASKFITTECLVFKVKLADIASKSRNGWTHKDQNGARSFLEKYAANNKKLKMLISKSDPLEVVLFEKHPNFEENINALLVENDLVLSTGKLSKTVQWLQEERAEEEEDNGFLPIYEDDTEDDDSEEEAQCVKIQVEIVRFDDPNSIYVSFVSRRLEAERLHEELQIHYKQVLELKDSWEVNDKIVVLDEKENCYYRGRIKEIIDDLYNVYLLDRGKDLLVPKDCLRGISEYFSNQPNVVLKCHLANIKPAGDSQKWSRISLEWFENIFKKYKDIHLMKISDDKSKSSMPVTMWYSTIIQGTALEPAIYKYISLDKKVVKAGLAFRVSSESLFPKTQKIMPTLKLSETNEICDIDVVVPNMNNTAPQELIYDCSIIDKKETQMDNENSGECPVLEWLPPLPLKKNEFYAYITCAETEGYLFIRDQELQPLFEDMKLHMKKHFDSIPKAKRFKPKQYQMVTILYEDFWYRGIVLSVINNETVKVMMVDYGSDHEVKVEHLHSKIMYPEVPIMVTKIKLYNVHSKTAKWTSLDVDILLHNVSEYSKITIRSGSNSRIPLADVYDFSGICLNDKLVKINPNLFRSDIMEPQKLMSEGESNQCRSSPRTESLGQSDPYKMEVPMFESKGESVKWSESTVHLLLEKDYSFCKLPRISPGSKILLDIVSVYDYRTLSIFAEDGNLDKIKFENLSEVLQEEGPGLAKITKIEVGMPCICQYQEDKLWYRAKIFNVEALNAYGYVTVFYVDYGNFDIVDVSDVKLIKDEWFNLPARFLLARLNYHLVDQQKEPYLLKHIQSLAGQSKLIEIIGYEPLKIHVYEDDNHLYYETFVKNGVVEI